MSYLVDGHSLKCQLVLRMDFPIHIKTLYSSLKISIMEYAHTIDMNRMYHALLPDNIHIIIIAKRKNSEIHMHVPQDNKRTIKIHKKRKNQQ